MTAKVTSISSMVLIAIAAAILFGASIWLLKCWLEIISPASPPLVP